MELFFFTTYSATMSWPLFVEFVFMMHVFCRILQGYMTINHAHMLAHLGVRMVSGVTYIKHSVGKVLYYYVFLNEVHDFGRNVTSIYQRMLHQ
jgi:hypothetical protein